MDPAFHLVSILCGLQAIETWTYLWRFVKTSFVQEYFWLATRYTMYGGLSLEETWLCSLSVVDSDSVLRQTPDSTLFRDTVLDVVLRLVIVSDLKLLAWQMGLLSWD